MRQLILAAMAGLVFAVFVTAADEEKHSIPQDAKWEKKRDDESLRWNRSTLAAAYDKVGKKDPRWDKPAHEALEAAARFFAKQIDPSVPVEKIYVPAKRAVDAGCDDALILYLYARSSYKPNYPGAKELERRYAVAAAAMEDSSYSPIRRFAAYMKVALAVAGRKNISKADRNEAVRLLDAALAELAKSVKQDERTYDTENLQFELPMRVVETLRKMDGDYQTAFDHVDAILAKTPALKAIRLQTRGNFLLNFGWSARGNGFANNVTQDGFKKFHERLAEARDVLNECWKVKPGDYRTANLMLAVEKGIGGDRDDMEKWFARAMKANGGDKNACEQKLDWLDPKWHGSQEEMMAFGRACRDTKNWRAGLTLLLAEAHRRAGLHKSQEERDKYLKSKEVREDIKAVYEEYLKHHPNDYIERSRYAVYCALGGRYAESDRQFKMLGNDFVSFTYWPRDWMNQVRAYVASQTKNDKKAKEK